ncbi:beta strand repeat-containing protein [Methanosphaera sp.]
MSNKKTILFVMTLMVLIIGISAVSAADIDSTNSTDIQADTVQSTISDSSINTVESTTKEITKTSSNDVTTTKSLKSDVQTHIINNSTVTQYFDKDNNWTLSDLVNDGDTLDIQGNISGLSESISMVINKPVNVISSTNDAYIDLNTTAGSLMGESPGSSFSILSGGSYSNVTGINLHNTQLWISGASYVVLDNISAVVEDQRVGSGVGQTSIRNNATYITLKNSYIRTKNNGGSSSFVLAWADHCTIDNCTIVGEGTVGNLMYLTTYNVNIAIPTGTKINSNNTITNNKVYGPATATGTCYCLGLTGYDNLVANNTFYYSGVGVTIQWGQGVSGNVTFINNTFYNGCGISGALANSTYINNTINNGPLTVGVNAQVENNTARIATLANNTTFTGNTITANVTVNGFVNMTNNTVGGIIINNANAKESSITNNTINGAVTVSKATNINISDNTIYSTGDYTIKIDTTGNTVTGNYLTTPTLAGKDTLVIVDGNTVENNLPEAGSEYNITDETYSNFFDEKGVLLNRIGNYSKINLLGTFNNKNFTFNNIIINVNGVNAVLLNSTVKSTNGASIKLTNVTINNTNSNDHAIILESDDNIIANVSINRDTTNNISQEIYITGTQNTVQTTNITTNSPASNIPYGADPAVANLAAIVVLADGNTITNNKIIINSTTSTSDWGYGSIEAITVQGSTKTTANNNKITNNQITITGTEYVYGINIGENTSSNTVQSNTINMNSNNYAAGIQIGYGTSTSNTIQSNTININATSYAYGLLVSVYGTVDVSGNKFISNKVTANANYVYLIEAYSSTVTSPVSGLNITSNTLVGTGNYTTGIAIVGKDTVIATNTITITGLTNETVTESYDLLKPTTAGILIQDSNNISINNKNVITITNGPAVKLTNTNNSLINSTNSKFISNNTDIILFNSNSNTIMNISANTTSSYSVSLENSSNNIIRNNTFYANNGLIGGDDAVTQDETSTDNTVEQNIPLIGVLTNETYSTYFNEEGVYVGNENITVLALGSDLYGVDFIFDGKTIRFTNDGNYTIYNGTFKFIGNHTVRDNNLVGINVNNVNKEALVLNLTSTIQVNVYMVNATIKVTGDNVTAIKENYNNGTGISYISITYSTIDVSGTNCTVIDFTGVNKTTSVGGVIEVLYTTINANAEDTSIVLDDKTSTVYFRYNNVTQTGKNVATIIGSPTMSYGNGFQYNNVNVSGDNVTIIHTTAKVGTTTSYLYYNNLTLTSDNPVTAITTVGAGNNIRYNNIFAYAHNGETPVISVAYNKSNAVTNNVIVAYDVSGNKAVEATGVTINSNTPSTVPVILTMDDVVGVINKEVTITATLTDLSGKAFTEGTIIFTDANGEILSTATVNDGVATCNYISSNIVVSTITATYSGNEIYASNITTAKLEITKLPTTITVDPVTASIGDVITLSASVVDGENNAITTGKVVFKVNGKTLRDEDGNVIYATVKDGKYVIENVEVLAGWAKEGSVITAVYGGYGDIGSSRVNSTFTVTKREAKATVDAVTVKAGESVTFTVKITDDVTVNSGKVVFKLNGKTLRDDNGNVLYGTVSNGVATVTYTLPAKMSAKAYTLTAVFSNGIYNRVDANSTLTITN